MIPKAASVVIMFVDFFSRWMMLAAKLGWKMRIVPRDWISSLGISGFL